MGRPIKISSVTQPKSLRRDWSTCLRSSKQKGASMTPYIRRCNQQGVAAPQFYGLPKICNGGIPLRPIVSSRGTSTYEAAKELAKIIRSLVGRSPHHTKNTKDFVCQIVEIQLQEGQYVSSLDVSALFTSVLAETAINILKRKTGTRPGTPPQNINDSRAHHRPTGVLLKTTYFHFRDS